MRKLFVATFITLVLAGTVEAKINDGILIFTIQGIASDGGVDQDRVLVEHAYKLLKTRRGINRARQIIQATWPGLITEDTKRYKELEDAGDTAIQQETKRLLLKPEIQRLIQRSVNQGELFGPPAAS